MATRTVVIAPRAAKPAAGALAALGAALANAARRFVAYVKLLHACFGEAQRMADAAQKRYPFIIE